jgi:ABC-type sugar transport system ATPase subunit
MGIRPEDIVFSEEGLPYTFVLDELLGNESLVHIKVRDTPLIVREYVTSTRPKRKPRIKFNTAGIRFFSTKSGIRLDSP